MCLFKEIYMYIKLNDCLSNYNNNYIKKQKQVRTRVLDVKNNFRNKYSNTKCRGSGQDEETQEHVLVQNMSDPPSRPHPLSQQR